jgi:hypothetical protein
MKHSESIDQFESSLRQIEPDPVSLETERALRVRIVNATRRRAMGRWALVGMGLAIGAAAAVAFSAFVGPQAQVPDPVHGPQVAAKPPGSNRHFASMGEIMAMERRSPDGLQKMVESEGDMSLIHSGDSGLKYSDLMRMEQNSNEIK